MSELFLPIIVGTSREARESIQVAKLAEETLSQRAGIITECIDPQNIHLPPDGNDEDGEDPYYADITKRADGFLIVMPEYNHGYPSSLKRVLDSEFANYRHKPVAFMGVSSGQWGGVRGIENLVPVIRKMGLVASRVDAQFPNVQDLFDKNGEALDKETHVKRMNRVFDELIWLAKTLKWGRENL